MNGETKTEQSKPVVVAKKATDLQKLKLDKLMKNPTKEVFIPEKSKEKEPRAPHEFIRNVWGSSAGAGSGDFHVYRGVRRREYARQKFITEKAEREEANSIYHKKVEENLKAAEERTAKKREKRKKNKEKQKAKKKKPNENKEKEDKDESEDESDNDNLHKDDVEYSCENGTQTTNTDQNGTSDDGTEKTHEDALVGGCSL